MQTDLELQNTAGPRCAPFCRRSSCTRQVHSSQQEYAWRRLASIACVVTTWCAWADGYGRWSIYFVQPQACPDRDLPADDQLHEAYKELILVQSTLRHACAVNFSSNYLVLVMFCGEISPPGPVINKSWEKWQTHNNSVYVWLVRPRGDNVSKTTSAHLLCRRVGRVHACLDSGSIARSAINWLRDKSDPSAAPNMPAQSDRSPDRGPLSLIHSLLDPPWIDTGRHASIVCWLVAAAASGSGTRTYGTVVTRAHKWTASPSRTYPRFLSPVPLRR
jgi:hypothetical protein